MVGTDTEAYASLYMTLRDQPVVTSGLCILGQPIITIHWQAFRISLRPSEARDLAELLRAVTLFFPRRHGDLPVAQADLPEGEGGANG